MLELTRIARSRARRASLLGWLRERPAHQGLTAGEIATVSGIYCEMRDGRGVATDDLYALGRAVWHRWDERRGQSARVWYPTDAEPGEETR